MKTAENSIFATYDPQRYKTFQGALEAFFEQECPQLGGARTRMTLVNAISKENREKILRIVCEKNYYFNAATRALSSKRAISVSFFLAT